MLCSFSDEDLVFKYAPWALKKNEALAAMVSDMWKLFISLPC